MAGVILSGTYFKQCPGNDPDHIVEEPVTRDRERDPVAVPLHTGIVDFPYRSL